MPSRVCIVAVVFASLFVLPVPVGSQVQELDKQLKTVLSLEDAKKSPYYKDKHLDIPISKEAGEQLYKHWTDQALSGLISAIATKKLSEVEEYDKTTHEQCSKQSKKIREHAKCLMRLLNDDRRGKLLRRRKDKHVRRRTGKRRKPAGQTPPSVEWVGAFRKARAKREIRVHNRDSFQLKSDTDRSPFGLIAKHLTNTVRIMKNKARSENWQTVVERIKKKAGDLKQKKKTLNTMKKRYEVFAHAARNLNATAELEQPAPKKRRPLAMKELEEVEKYIEDEEVREMLHQKAENMTEEDKLMLMPTKIIREAAKIGLMMDGKNKSVLDGKTLRIISPRLMSIMPEEESSSGKEMNLFSPSLFALHTEGKGIEKATSLTSLLGTNFERSDSQQWIDFIVEATGVSEAVDDAEKKLEETDRKHDVAMGLKGPDGQPLFFTKENMTRINPREVKKIEIMEKLETTYTSDQMREMNRTGYTVLSREQQLLLYGKHSPYKNAELLKTAANMTKTQIRRSMHDTIRDIADGRRKFEVRQNDIVLSPIVSTNLIFAPNVASQPIILSPVLMSALVGSPAIFGVVVLSPWLFVPVILSPRILSPVILSPFLFAPIILSPLALIPVVLSPGIGNPLVLSPMLMVPFILSPQVMTPIILSPFVLTPLILNPMLLSPLVLSPFVLSPSIMSPAYVTGLILSPYALSPSVQSNGALITVFGSPSWLS